MQNYLQTKLSGPRRVEADARTPGDVKPIISEDGLAGIKMTPFNPPKFSGEQKDWIPFWSEFKAIHTSSRYAAATKLSYLRQAQQNSSLRRQIGACIDNGDSYETVVAMLQDQFDRPRLMHKIYVDQLLGIGQVKPYKSSILDCANTLQSVWDGLSRLGQCDSASIFTTVAENLLPKELRIRWEDETITSKKVPPVQRLIEFLRLRSTQPQYEDKSHYSSSAPEKKSSKPKSSGHHGSIHVASGQPVQSVNPQTESNRSNSYVKGQSHSQKPRTQSFPPCRYTCPLCQEAHYAYSCRVFKEKAVSQRMEHVVAQSLCVKCLKAGHDSESCRNPRTCSVYQGEHNTLLHGAPLPGTSLPVVTGTVNALSSVPTVNSLQRNKLLMTCQALITGPNGKSMPARILLDSGADLSSVTTRVARHLQLIPTEPVSVGAWGNSENQICQSADFTINTMVKSDWQLTMSAVITDRITGIQPRQDAAIVREIAEAQGWDLADPKFDQPGRIDVLLGADVLPYVQKHQSPVDSIMSVETVFGHALMGTYPDKGPLKPRQGTIHIVTDEAVPTPTADEILNATLSRFWELEEPPQAVPAFTPEELRVQKEYALKHVFLPSAGKYQVELPRKVTPLPLGESRGTALRRYHSNERALLRKGHWQQFQQVIQEYLDLDHARPVTAAELLLPNSEVFYLPMHGVHKSTSTTTKLRVVFDASSKATNGISLNDTLAVGPMLNPPLDQILLRFRTHRVALSGDISKMYREILLSPPDQQYHRFLWRPQ